MEFLNWKTLQLPLATALATISPFPDKPDIIKRYQHHPLVQWLFVFIFVWQGGAGQNWQLALVATIVFYIVLQAIQLWDATFDKDQFK